MEINFQYFKTQLSQHLNYIVLKDGDKWILYMEDGKCRFRINNDRYGPFETVESALFNMLNIMGVWN